MDFTVDTASAGTAAAVTKDIQDTTNFIAEMQKQLPAATSVEIISRPVTTTSEVSSVFLTPVTSVLVALALAFM